MLFEYDPNKFQYVMKFRKVGIVNVSTAQTSGRAINVDNRQVYAAASGEHSGERLVNTVTAQFQYDDADDKYKIKVKVDDELNANAALNIASPAMNRIIVIRMNPLRPRIPRRA